MHKSESKCYRVEPVPGVVLRGITKEKGLVYWYREGLPGEPAAFAGVTRGGEGYETI